MTSRTLIELAYASFKITLAIILAILFVKQIDWGVNFAQAIEIGNNVSTKS